MTDGMTVNTGAASADPRFVSPDLVQIDAGGKPHLMGGRCKNCSASSFPRSDVCTSCLSEDIEAVTLGDEGTLYSFSIVHQAPRGWNTPYALGYVDLSDEIRVLAHIDIPTAAIAIDMPVKLAVGVVGSDDSGMPMYSYTFKER
ncbi:MAG: Zn-ribbon domain-containing OB-fold protein [Xanthobacteraceae bacterium]